MNAAQPSLRELFEAVVALEAAARQDFLDAHGIDAVCRAELEALIAADADEAEPLAEGAVERIARAIGPPAPAHSLPPGSRIGAFRLREVLGEGGSSTVFHATRNVEGAIQHVALKLMRRGLYSPEAQRLFRREQRALIQLVHPNIARMIEGGVTESALPYIALELVDGAPITDHAARRSLDLRERLKLFAVVCHAVDAAHRALIVHRDLKPSNVLVTDEGEVKLLDFGIAKLLAEDDGSLTQLPAFTPAYAAPEQRDGGAITTATDVYALGVLLGELVTGERVNDGSGRTPSSWMTTRSGTDPDANVTPISRRQVRGDLDAIVLKALELDPARRHASAGRLADDIERLLAGQPVSAQPATGWYRTRKFVLRHKGGVASTVVFLIAILSALGIAVWQAQLAREQARLARNESTRANATLGFITDLLKSASADLPKDQRPTPEALVKDAARNAREDPDLDPLVRAQLLLTLGEIAFSNGDNGNAERLIDEAIRRERALQIPASSAEWITALVAKGNLLHSTNRSREADGLMRDLVPLIEAIDTEGAVSALMLYATTRAYARDADQAAALAKRALAKAWRVFGEASINGVETATFLGQLCSNLGRYAEAETLLEEGTARWRRVGLPLSEQYARSLFHLAVSKQHLGKRSEVEALYRDGIDLMRRVQEGPNHRLSQGLVGYALFLIESDRLNEAKVLLDEALANDQAVFGMDHVRTANTLDAIGLLHMAMQDPEAANIAVLGAFDIFSRHAREAGYEPELARTNLHRATVSAALGNSDTAAGIVDAALPDLSTLFGANSVEVAEALIVKGQIALDRNAPSDALREVDRAIETLQALELPAVTSEVAARTLRCRILLALDRSRDSIDESTLAVSRLLESTPNATIKHATLIVLRARAERALGNTKAAETLLDEARALHVPPARLAMAEREILIAEGGKSP